MNVNDEQAFPLGRVYSYSKMSLKNSLLIYAPIQETDKKKLGNQK